MINQSSNQTSGTRPKVLYVSKTITPAGYEKSTEGFNSWEQMLALIAEGGSNGSEEHRLELRALLMFAGQFEGYYK